MINPHSTSLEQQIEDLRIQLAGFTRVGKKEIAQVQATIADIRSKFDLTADDAFKIYQLANTHLSELEEPIYEAINDWHAPWHDAVADKILFIDNRDAAYFLRKSHILAYGHTIRLPNTPYADLPFGNIEKLLSAQENRVISITELELLLLSLSVNFWRSSTPQELAERTLNIIAYSHLETVYPQLEQHNARWRFLDAIWRNAIPEQLPSGTVLYEPVTQSLFFLMQGPTKPDLTTWSDYYIQQYDKLTQEMQKPIRATAVLARAGVGAPQLLATQEFMKKYVLLEQFGTHPSPLTKMIKASKPPFTAVHQKPIEDILKTGIYMGGLPDYVADKTGHQIAWPHTKAEGIALPFWGQIRIDADRTLYLYLDAENDYDNYWEPANGTNAAIINDQVPDWIELRPVNIDRIPHAIDEIRELDIDPAKPKRARWEQERETPSMHGLTRKLDKFFGQITPSMLYADLDIGDAGSMYIFWDKGTHARMLIQMS